MKKLIVDAQTGEQQYLDFTPEEVAEAEANNERLRLKREAREAEELAKEQAKQSAIAKLQTLGLTEEEALALLS